MYGYPLNLQIVRGADQPVTTQFSFSMLVTTHKLMENNKIDDLYTVPETIDSLAARQLRSALFYEEQQILREMDAKLVELGKAKYADGIPQEEVNWFKQKEDRISEIHKKIAELTTNIINPDIANARVVKELDG